MIQSLLLEKAWEKQISPQDRQLVEDCFGQTNNPNGKNIAVHYIRHDYNHKQALLVMVLIHNFTNDILHIDNDSFICSDEKGNVVANNKFTLPIEIPSTTSMPWTLIYPFGAYESTGKESKLTISLN